MAGLVATSWSNLLCVHAVQGTMGAKPQELRIAIELMFGVLLLAALPYVSSTSDAQDSNLSDLLPEVPIDYSFASKGSAAEMRTPCPAWMAEYAAFHNANKHSPDARYLIYHCALSDAQSCNGLGDRLRGIMFMTRIAHGTGRILLINNTQPVDFSNVFEPSGFDWQVGNISSPCSNITAPCNSVDASGRTVSSMYWNSDGEWWTPDWLINGSLLEGEAAKATHFYMTAITFPSSYLGDWAPYLPSWRDFGRLSPSHCLFSMLFQASPAVDQRVKEFEVQLGVHNPGRRARYVAIHLRLGIDNTAEQRQVHPNLNASFVCALQLGRMHHVTDMAVATDSGKMRKAIREGAYPGFSAVDITATHIHFVPHGDELALQKFIDTVAEFVLLARSTCLIMSGSGFSETALMMGGHSCWSTVDWCSDDFGDQVLPIP